MADGSYQGKVYRKQGGDALVVKNGGKAGRITGAAFTIGSETSNVINVAIQLQDAEGDDLDEIGVVQAYLSDDSGGDGVAASAPSSGIAIGTDGTILAEIVTDKVFLLQSESDGDIDVDIDTSTSGESDTWYLVVVLPDGTVAVSGAITFA